MINKWIWLFGLIIVWLLYPMGTVEAKIGGMPQGAAWNPSGGSAGTHVPSSSQGARGCCAESVERQRLARPQRNVLSESRRRKVRRRSRKVLKQGRRHPKRKNLDRTEEEETTTQVITRKVGSGPILKHLIDRMGVVGVIDSQAVLHPNRKISHGEMAAALMIYLLNDGRALYRMEKWAQDTAILSPVFVDYQAGDWTDDRIGDTLDELYEAGLEPMQGSISAHIVTEFGLELKEIHYDTTSVSMWGTYDPDTEQPAVVITFGYSKDHRPDLKQLVLGMGVTGDGGVPLISATHNGNTSDSVLPLSYWERLRQVVGKSSFCFIGDCKIASVETLKEVCTQDGVFLAPLPMTQTEQIALVKRLTEGDLKFERMSLEQSQKPIYEKRTNRAGNRRKKGEPKEDCYEVYEDSWPLVDNRGRTHTLRKLIIRSGALARLHARTRERRLVNAESELQGLRRKLNKRKLKTREAIETAANNVVREKRVQEWMELRVEEHVETVRKKIGKGRPGPNSQYVTEENHVYDLVITRRQEAIDKDALLDGLFLMVTNHDPSEYPASRVLALYKRQYLVERIFSVMKGPLAVSPMLLEKPQRICSMMFIMTLTLQLYTLIQRQVAHELLQRGYPLDGLMPNRIQTWRPQTRELLAAFDNIYRVQIVDKGKLKSFHVTTLSPVQLEILGLLGVPPKLYSPLFLKSGET